MQEVTDILKRSIQYSLDHRAAAVEYALQFGRDLNRDLADQFVGMYVNDWTLDYGPRGREAITRLLGEGRTRRTRARRSNKSSSSRRDECVLLHVAAVLHRASRERAVQAPRLNDGWRST